MTVWQTMSVDIQRIHETLMVLTVGFPNLIFSSESIHSAKNLKSVSGVLSEPTGAVQTLFFA